MAIIRDERVVKYRNIKADRVLSSTIVPNIEKMLTQADLPLKDVDCFAVGLGPGSFTSLRVGLATIKGLAFAMRKPILGIPSLDITAQGVAHLSSDVCSVMDARRGMVFFCQYRVTNGRAQKVSPYHLAALAFCLKGLKGDILFVGDGIEPYKNVLRKIKIKKFCPRLADIKFCQPQAKNMLPLIKARLEKGQFDDPHKLTPLYLYPDDCQIRK